MKSWELSKLIVGCVFSIAGCWAVKLWAELDMYVYNVGQANCILTIADDASGVQSAIFFDTGAQAPNTFAQNIMGHIRTKITPESINSIWFVFTHTDNDHVNVFEDIAEICPADKIRGVIVGTVDILDYDTINKLNINDINADDRYQIGSPEAALAGIKKKLNTIINCIAGLNVPISVVSGARYYTYDEGAKWQADTDNFIFNLIAENMNIAFGGNKEIHTVDFLHPNAEYKVGKDANAASIVTRLTCPFSAWSATRYILLTGDAPGRLFLAICLKENDTANSDNISKLNDISVLVYPHHGSIANGENLWYGELKRPWMLSIISSGPSVSSNSISMPYRWWIGQEIHISNFSLCNDHDIICAQHTDKYRENIGRDSICQYQTKAPIFVTGAANIGYHVNIADDGVLTIFQMKDAFGDESLLFPSNPIQSPPTSVTDEFFE